MKKEGKTNKINLFFSLWLFSKYSNLYFYLFKNNSQFTIYYYCWSFYYYGQGLFIIFNLNNILNLLLLNLGLNKIKKLEYYFKMLIFKLVLIISILY